MKNNPRILIFSVASWNSHVGSNTWSTLLEGYPSEKIANICIREEYPDSDICSRYFIISENRILKSIFSHNIKTGYEVIKNGSNQNNSDLQEHTSRYRKLSAKRKTSMLIARELVWIIGKWKSKELDAFLDDFKPEIILHSMEGYIHLNRIIEYSISRTKAKAIGYIWDDNFTYKQLNKLGHQFLRYFQRNSLKRLAKKTNAFFAISKKTKEEADSFFKINSTILTKPLISTPHCIPNPISYPIHMLYSGKLIIGRADTIRCVSNAISAINNKYGPKFVLDIYTNTVLSKEEQEMIASAWCQIHPAVSQNEVYLLQAQSDILLFAEALDGPNAKIPRLSFSTKITDYLSTGKCIFAVGYKETAPMEYFIENHSAITVNSSELIESTLECIMKNPDTIYNTAVHCVEVAMNLHNPQIIKERFWKVIYTVLQSNT